VPNKGTSIAVAGGDLELARRARPNQQSPRRPSVTELGAMRQQNAPTWYPQPCSLRVGTETRPRPACRPKNRTGGTVGTYISQLDGGVCNERRRNGHLFGVALPSTPL
jgi:hypothetical protein